MIMILRIPADLLKIVEKHAVREYPYECCGLLLGKRRGEEATVLQVAEARNIYLGDRRAGYLVDPMDYYGAELRAEAEGMEVLGIYHSHPNKPAKPSRKDRSEAYQGYFYLIVSVYNRDVKDVGVWRLGSEKVFKPVKLITL